MKILLVTTWQCGLFAESFSYHGDWTLVFDAALALRTHGVQVGIVAPESLSQHRPRFEEEFGQVLANAGVQVFFSPAHAPKGSTGRLARWHLTMATLRAIRRFQPDVIQYWEASPQFPRWVVRKTRIVSVVRARFSADTSYTNRGKDQEAMGRWGRTHLSLRDHLVAFVARVVNKLWKLDQIDHYPRHCDCLVTNQRATYRRLRRRRGRWQELVYYIPKGMRVSAADAHKPAKGYPSNTVEVLFVGIISHGKGVFDLIEAFRQVSQAMPSARLTIVGNGPLDMVAKAQDLICRWDLDDVVTMVGSVGYHEKWKYYWNCDVFCVPSYADVFPGATREAFSCGKPVVITPQVDDWIVEGESGLRVPPSDVDALAQALLHLLGDDELRRRMGAATRGIAEAHRLEDMAGAFIELYDRLLGERHGHD